MEVKLLHSTPLWVADLAISKCCDKEYNKDEINIRRIENNKNENIIKHIVFNFEINGVSRELLQELKRHRMASLSVKNTKYMLKELKNESPFNSKTIDRAKRYVVLTENAIENVKIIRVLEKLRMLIKSGTPNYILKLAFPKEYKINSVWSINAKSLQIFLKSKTSPYEIWEIKKLVNEIYDKIPTSYKFLFEKEIHSKR